MNRWHINGEGKLILRAFENDRYSLKCWIKDNPEILTMKNIEFDMSLTPFEASQIEE